MEIREYIHKLRVSKGLSQRKLADLAKISNTEIYRIESGERQKVSPDILKAIAPHLGVSYESLMESAGYIINASGRFGKELSDRLINMKLTINEVVPSIGLSADVLYKILRTEKGPTRDEYIRLGTWLGYTEEKSAELYLEEMNLASPITVPTLAAHRIDGYDEPLTEDEVIMLKAVLEAYRRGKQDKKG